MYVLSHPNFSTLATILLSTCLTMRWLPLLSASALSAPVIPCVRAFIPSSSHAVVGESGHLNYFNNRHRKKSSTHHPSLIGDGKVIDEDTTSTILSPPPLHDDGQYIDRGLRFAGVARYDCYNI